MSGELVSQIEEHINFCQTHVFREGKKPKAILAGGSDLKDIREQISRKMDIETEIGNPLVNVSENNNVESLSYSTAIGLALKL
jgi:Tfp pilus assembly PilM family ATPase